jgi:hypothetical protein
MYAGHEHRWGMHTLFSFVPPQRNFGQLVFFDHATRTSSLEDPRVVARSLVKVSLCELDEFGLDAGASFASEQKAHLATIEQRSNVVPHQTHTTRTHARARARTHTHTHVHAHAHTHTRTRTRTHTRARTQKHTHTHTHTHTATQPHAHASMCAPAKIDTPSPSSYTHRSSSHFLPHRCCADLYPSLNARSARARVDGWTVCGCMQCSGYVHESV